MIEALKAKIDFFLSNVDSREINATVNSLCEFFFINYAN